MRAVARLVADPADLVAQERVLVQGLCVLGYLVPGQRRQTAEQTTHDEVDGGNDHSAMIPTGKSAEQDPVIEPHRLRISVPAPRVSGQVARLGDVFLKHCQGRGPGFGLQCLGGNNPLKGEPRIRRLRATTR